MDIGSCPSTHRPFVLFLTVGVTIGLVLSYLPQHLRIIRNRSSEGISPWFLLLGSISSSAGMLNVVALQWPVIRCCREVSTSMCLENLGGVFQVVMQCGLFIATLVLFLIFYPPKLKYVELLPEHYPEPFIGLKIGADLVTTAEWRLAVVLSSIVALHLGFCAFVTALLIQNSESSSFSLWTTFLGVSGALCTAIQFIPQIYKTWRSKLVGSLSILMMCIQSPGAVVMCLSIGIRPGTNWTSWATYAASGSLQAILLTMCLLWKDRQARLGIDDFGRPLPSEVVTPGISSESELAGDATPDEDERLPLLARS